MKKKIILFLAICSIPLILASCSHTHSWQGATCTQASVCTGCGESQGEPLGHKWQAATCTDAKKCTACNLEEGSPLAHDWQEATCTSAKQCKVCSATEGEPIPHTVEKWKITQEATCTKEGSETGKCTECQQNISRETPLAEHTLGDWKVIKEATANSKGERAKKCSVCKETVETEEFSLSAKEIKEAYKAKCKKYSYSKIARNPNEYKGKYAKFTGEVVQVMQEEFLGYITYVLRVNVTKKGSYYKYYTDTVYVSYTVKADAARILEDDIITMYGQLDGEKTYKTVMGSSVTIPKFNAEYIDIK